MKKTKTNSRGKFGKKGGLTPNYMINKLLAKKDLNSSAHHYVTRMQDVMYQYGYLKGRQYPVLLEIYYENFKD